MRDAVTQSGADETRALLEERGLPVRTIDLSELQKAEAGVTCTSLIFDHEAMTAEARRP